MVTWCEWSLIFFLLRRQTVAQLRRWVIACRFDLEKIVNKYITFQPTGQPDSEAAVIIPQSIGTVYRAWFRYGGNCWTNSRNASMGFTTRKEAAENCLDMYCKSGEA